MVGNHTFSSDIMFCSHVGSFEFAEFKSVVCKGEVKLGAETGNHKEVHRSSNTLCFYSFWNQDNVLRAGVVWYYCLLYQYKLYKETYRIKFLAASDGLSAIFRPFIGNGSPRVFSMYNHPFQRNMDTNHWFACWCGGLPWLFVHFPG